MDTATWKRALCISPSTTSLTLTLIKKKQHTSIYQVMKYIYILFQSTLFIPTLNTMTKFVIMAIWRSWNLRSRGDS